MSYEYGSPSYPIEETLTMIREWLMQVYRAEFRPSHRCSPRQRRRLRRIRGWDGEIRYLSAEIDRVKREALPQIERDVGYTFQGPDGLLRILMDTSIKRLSSGILREFPEDLLPLPAKDIDMFGRFPDGVQALALIGDVTLRLKVLSGPHTGMPGLAPLSDRWGLHEHKLGLRCRHRPIGTPLEREKEALARAVLGLLYVEGGIDALRAAVPLIAGCPA